MQVQRIQSNNNTSFSAKIDVKPVKGMITGEEIAKLQEKAKTIGNKNSLIKIIINQPYSRAEGDIYAGTVYHGYKMPAITYHKGKLDLKNIGPEIQMDSLFKYSSTELKDKYKPYTIINKWLDKAFASSKK